ncbi:phosphoadenosine phosphosulfate reductase domain-containing protein [Streptomyces chartreusis]|uniref:phosphoadenosine phosphosulfate reductase domain-containing protein n=1 Tax=Streptomyces chartreusis TaxID=1969 RepID=UPI0033B4FF01
MDITTRLYLLDLVRQAQQSTAAHAAAVRAAARAAKAVTQARDRVDELARQRPTAQDPEQPDAATGELDQALEEYTDCRGRLQAANRKVARTFLAARAANRTLGATYAQHAHGRARAASRDEVAASLLDELADVPLELLDAAHAILVQSSAGKDSLVQLHRIATWAEKAGCLDKVVVIHIDLGEESEWPGVRELAQRQAERYGLRFHVLRAEGGLLGLVEKRGMWPDAARRLCTATLKRDVANKLLRQIAAELGLDEQAVILNCMGIRAAESPARSKNSGQCCADCINGLAVKYLDSTASRGRPRRMVPRRSGSLSPPACGTPVAGVLRASVVQRMHHAMGVTGGLLSRRVMDGSREDRRHNHRARGRQAARRRGRVDAAAAGRDLREDAARVRRSPAGPPSGPRDD